MARWTTPSWIASPPCSPPPTPRDEIARALNAPMGQVAAALLELSLAGRAELLPGGLASI